jgi:hypothetical protein
MAAKKAKSVSDKPLKATIKKLRSDLAAAETKRDRWKKRALKAEASAADLWARVKVAEKKVKKARKPDAASTPVSRPKPPAVSADALAAPPSAEQSGSSDGVPATIPDATWTVTRLRAEARRRGIAGMSKKPKAELLAALA